MKAISSGIINVKTGQIIALKSTGGTINLNLKARELNKGLPDLENIVFSFTLSHSAFVLDKIFTQIGDAYPEQVRMICIYRNRFYIEQAMESLRAAKDEVTKVKETLIQITSDTPNGEYLEELIKLDLVQKEYEVNSIDDRLSILYRTRKSLEEPEYSVIAIYERGVTFDDFGATESVPMVRKVLPFMPNENDVDAKVESILIELAQEKGCSIEELKAEISVETWEI